jgi:hypothetical protein
VRPGHELLRSNALLKQYRKKNLANNSTYLKRIVYHKQLREYNSETRQHVVHGSNSHMDHFQPKETKIGHLNNDTPPALKSTGFENEEILVKFPATNATLGVFRHSQVKFWRENLVPLAGAGMNNAMYITIVNNGSLKTLGAVPTYFGPEVKSIMFDQHGEVRTRVARAYDVCINCVKLKCI